MQGKSSKMKISIYTYWKLAEPRQLKQLQNTAPQALIDGANIWTASDCTTSIFRKTSLLGSSILNHRNSRLDPHVSRLDPRISKHSSFETRGSSLEFQASSVNLLLSGTVSVSSVKMANDKARLTITAVQIGLYQFTTCLESRMIHSDQPLLLTTWISGKINLTWNIDRWLN